MTSLDRHGTRLARAAALAIPFLLIHAPSAAEAVIGGLAVGLLLRMALLRDATALRAPWMLAALAYWAWIVAATAVAGAGWERVGAAIVWLRFPLAALALGTWVLAEARARRWMLASAGAALAWVVLEVWVQLAFGRSLSGREPHPGGILTGPFGWARAGPYLALALWPPLLVAMAWAIARRRAWLALLLPAAVVASVVVIGQRMPVLQVLFGLGLGALALPALRRPALLAGLAAAALLAASPILAPEAFRRLVVEGLVEGSAIAAYRVVWDEGFAVAAAAPWSGFGFDGLQAGCAALGIANCPSHPHNVYLEAAVEGGLPALLLFVAMGGALLAAVAPPLLRGGGAEGLGLVIALVIAATAVTALKSGSALHQAGHLALIAGWALAAARDGAPRRA
jgi:O-antigen ligase